MKRIIKKIKNIISIFKEFGIGQAKYEFLLQFVFRKNNSFRKKIVIKRDNLVKKYLLNNYRYVIDNYKNINEIDNTYIKNDSPVFIFWWQGISEAPEIVKICIESIKNNVDLNRLKIIDKENYSQYLDIPDYVINKLNDGVISITHFSDLLRVGLLYQHGGIWIDATVFLNGTIPNEIYKYKFYTVRHNLYADFHICKGMWSTSFLAAAPKSQLMKYIRDFLLEYWKKEKYVITYLLFDCIISTGYDCIDFVREELENVPINNTDFFEIENNINKVYDVNIFDINKSNTFLYKTSYKRKIIENVNGEDTFYSIILKKGNNIK